MIETLLDFAKTNQLLAAGIGTVGFGSVMYFLRSLPGRALGIINRLFTLELAIDSDSPLYYEVAALLSRHRLGMLRNFTTGHDGEIVAGYGHSVGRFRNCFFTFSRTRVEDKTRRVEQIALRLYSRDVRVLDTLLGEARHPSDQDKIKIFTGSHYWGSPVRKRKRSLDTIFVNGDAKQAIIDKIEWFFANEAWYEQRGIPYKLVMLFHGLPGTGKTRLIYGLASYFNQSLGTVKSVAGLDGLLRDAPDRSFIAIEDIDMLTEARAESPDDDEAPAPATPQQTSYDGSSSLQILINALDGIATPHGMVVFITTNHREKLDEALVRKGRIDIDLEIGPIDRETAGRMFAAFYGERASLDGYVPHTGAELQAIFLDEPDHSRAAVAIRAVNDRAEDDLDTTRDAIAIVEGHAFEVDPTPAHFRWLKTAAELQADWAAAQAATQQPVHGNLGFDSLSGP